MSGSIFYSYSTAPRKMLSLQELSRNHCSQNVHLISDVGDCPYYLIESVLRKMTSKQLSKIESSKPEIMAETDQLWLELIKKDFPDRPYYEKSITNLRIKSLNKIKGFRKLYFKYTEERELFRKHSAERLRDMTARFKSEKEKKYITTLTNFPADPTSRKRKLAGQSYNSPILKKAKKDLEKRALMFNGVNKPEVKSIFSTNKTTNTSRERSESSQDPSKDIRYPNRQALSFSATNKISSQPDTHDSLTKMGENTNRMSSQVAIVIPDSTIETASRTIKVPNKVKKKASPSIFIKKTPIASQKSSPTSRLAGLNSKNCTKLYEISKFPKSLKKDETRSKDCQSKDEVYKAVVLKSSIFSRV